MSYTGAMQRDFTATFANQAKTMRYKGVYIFRLNEKTLVAHLTTHKNTWNSGNIDGELIRAPISS